MDKPMFETLCCEKLQHAISVVEDRGTDYGDTLKHNQWLAASSICKRLGMKVTKEEIRAIVMAGLYDIKYQRLEGGYREDHITDSINYASVIPGCLKSALASGQSKTDIVF